MIHQGDLRHGRAESSVCRHAARWHVGRWHVGPSRLERSTRWPTPLAPSVTPAPPPPTAASPTRPTRSTTASRRSPTTKPRRVPHHAGHAPRPDGRSLPADRRGGGEVGDDRVADHAALLLA